MIPLVISQTAATLIVEITVQLRKMTWKPKDRLGDQPVMFLDIEGGIHRRHEEERQGSEKASRGLSEFARRERVLVEGTPAPIEGERGDHEGDPITGPGAGSASPRAETSPIS